MNEIHEGAAEERRVGLGSIAYNKGRSIARPAPHCAGSRLQ